MKPQLNINKTFPKKSLGQNFIQNKNFIFKLSSFILSDNDTNIFEIGPGLGALTVQLAKKNFKNLYLIEKDFLLFQKLEDRFKDDNWDIEQIPYLRNAQANIFCKVDKLTSYHTHTIVVGLVKDANYSNDISTLTYVDGEYR